MKDHYPKIINKELPLTKVVEKSPIGITNEKSSIATRDKRLLPKTADKKPSLVTRPKNL